MDLGDQYHGELAEKGVLYNVHMNNVKTHLLSLLCF